jgi:hypothetical protein
MWGWGWDGRLPGEPRLWETSMHAGPCILHARAMKGEGGWGMAYAYFSLTPPGSMVPSPAAFDGTAQNRPCYPIPRAGVRLLPGDGCEGCADEQTLGPPSHLHHPHPPPSEPDATHVCL